MASRPSDFDELLELHRQAEELWKGDKITEAAQLRRQFRQALEALRHQIEDLIKARKYAEAVPLAQQLAQAVEGSSDAGILEVSEVLIDLAELLIAVGRSAEAEPLLRRAFETIVEEVEVERNRAQINTALRERISQIDPSRLIHSVSALRGLIAYRYELGSREPRRLLALREPYGGREISPEEAQRQRAEADAREAERSRTYEALRLASEAAAREEDRRRQRPATTVEQMFPPPSGAATSAPAPHPADMKRERGALHQNLAGRATATDLEARSIVLASFSTTREHTPDPSTPEGALEIEAGRLAYQIPERMWVGVQESVEVRLGAAIANEIMQGFTGRGDVRIEDVPIVETMKVSLVCRPGAFDIEPRSEEVQLVKPDLVKGTPLHLYDFGRWQWLVTPRQRGKHTLSVKVSAAIRDRRGLPTTSSLPDKVITVEVRVHLVHATAGLVRRMAPLVVSGVVTSLVGIFTKDYWWPYVRDIVWPAVLAFAGL